MSGTVEVVVTVKVTVTVMVIVMVRKEKQKDRRKEISAATQMAPGHPHPHPQLAVRNPGLEDLIPSRARMSTLSSEGRPFNQQQQWQIILKTRNTTHDRQRRRRRCVTTPAFGRWLPARDFRSRWTFRADSETTNTVLVAESAALRLVSDAPGPLRGT